MKMYPHSKGEYLKSSGDYKSEKFDHHPVDKRPCTVSESALGAPKFDSSLHHGEGSGIIPAKSSY